eukprot:m.450254 g.450254  ORF g.450254 m.450254 type:complete len:182 (-) comp19952_c0_seq1:1517-2062(-)
MNGVVVTDLGTEAPTATPTSAAPTQAPTNWYEHANFSVLSSRITVLEGLLTRMTSVEATTTSLTTAVAEIATLRAQVASLNATVMQQGAMLSAIRASILDVVDTLARPVTSPPSSPPPPCNGRGCRPTLVADGSNLNIQATAGGVTVTTAQCGVFDPCSDRMATNRTLATILNALGNLALV